MIKIYDSILDSDTCDLLYNFVVEKFGHLPDKEVKNVPWENGDNIPVRSIDRKDIIEAVIKHQNNIIEKIQQDYDDTVYAEFSDLVLWRRGHKMGLHKDDGHEGIKNRHYSSVTYLNDDYEGGSTYFESGFVSEPVKGRTVVFYSDSRTLHGVNSIKKGIRVTLPIWFTRNEKAREDLHEYCK